MQKFLDVTGKTDSIALENGLAQLGLDRDDVSVEILSRGKTGFLGIGSVPAKVRITYEVPDEPEVKEEPKVEPKIEPVAEPKAEAVEPPAPVDAPAAPDYSRPAPAKNRPRQKERRGKQPSKAQPVQPQQSAKPEPVSVEADDEIANAIVQFQTGLFERMNVPATPVVTHAGDVYYVNIQGEDVGALIGHRGETLNSIQQITNSVVKLHHSRRFQVRVDAENYRARREDSLNKLARRTAEKVLRYRRNITLEPMNAYERHVIHAALQDYDGVITRSTGVEPNRKVVVIYDQAQKG